MGKRKNFMKHNYQFVDSLIINDATYIDYLERFKKVALSIFEWVNLPKSMNAMWLEKCLYYHGEATLLKDKNYGFINTNCASSGNLNIYGLPVAFNCYSFEYSSNRKLYTGLNPLLTEAQRKQWENYECILVQNNWDRTPTSTSMELFSYRLYEAERTADVNIKSQKTPVLLLVDEKQRLTMENMYSQFDGNRPAIFGDSKNLNPDSLRAIRTEAPYIADKIMDYKKEIWNEALTFLRN